MPLTVSNNSAVASASYYLGQEPKGSAAQHQKAGQWQKDHQSQ